MSRERPLFERTFTDQKSQASQRTLLTKTRREQDLDRVRSGWLQEEQLREGRLEEEDPQSGQVNSLVI